MKEKILLRIPKELKEKLKSKAERKGLSLTAFIINVLWEIVKVCEKE